MRSNDIKGEIKVSKDEYENIRISWFMFDYIPFEVVMTYKALKLGSTPRLSARKKLGYLLKKLGR